MDMTERRKYQKADRVTYCGSTRTGIKNECIKAKIDRSQEDSKCRRCKAADETVSHIVSECSKLAQKEYKRQHDWVGRRIHWEVCRKLWCRSQEEVVRASARDSN